MHPIRRYILNQAYVEVLNELHIATRVTLSNNDSKALIPAVEYAIAQYNLALRFLYKSQEKVGLRATKVSERWDKKARPEYGKTKTFWIIFKALQAMERQYPLWDCVCGEIANSYMTCPWCEGLASDGIPHGSCPQCLRLNCEFELINDKEYIICETCGPVLMTNRHQII